MHETRFLTLKRKLYSFFNSTQIERALFFEAYLLLGLARATVLILPFKLLSRHWGIPHSEGLYSTPKNREFLGQLSRAIHTASRYTPWKSNCLPQALAAKRMLHRRSYTSTLYLGISTANTSSTGAISAHAWLRCADTWICGYRASQGFTVVATFSESQETVTG